MNDRTLDNQFPTNSLNSEQLRQMQNIAAFLAQYFTPGSIPLNNFAGLPTANNAAPPPAAPPVPPTTNNTSATALAAGPAAANIVAPAPGDEQITNQRLQIQQTIRLLRQQQQRQQQQQQQQQRQQQQQQRQQQHQQQHQQQLIQQEFTQRLQQQLQQIVQQSQRQQQPHPSHTSLAAGEPTSLTIRQQQSLQNSLQPGLLQIPDQQKRKRGRPPLSKPSTSAGSSTVDYNYLNMFTAVKNQQDKERLQRESKLQQDRQREIRQQQERERQRELRLAQERQERQRELRLQQERERQRLEMERQRKTQHRLALQDIDRERRRQHMIMVRNLDAYKRNEEREKTMNAMMAERNKQNERRMYQKRLEVELIKDIRKPIDDMMLKNHKPLATLNRIPGLKLPGKAFADLLMSYEFLCNFGETVGLEAKEIPDINTLQLGLLNLNTWAEDQFISIMHHLCMFVIKDPRFPYTGSLKEIESLERTNEGLSQLLHFYLQVLTLNAKTEMEHEFRLYKLIEQKYFLSLNATQKAEILAFICNELLCSQTVTKQMEDTIENVAKLRKDKWVLENELRKFRGIKTKRELKEEAELKAREASVNNINGESGKNEEEKINDSKDQLKSDIKKEDEDKNNKTTLTNGSSVTENTPNKRENDTDTSAQPHNDLDELEPRMTNEELNKKIENLTRNYNKTSNKLERAINSMRACPLGQDRFRRRYWVLPQVGGVFVEGMESSEPEELANNKFTEEELEEYEKEQQALNELANNDAEEAPGEEQNNDTTTEEADIKEEKEDEEMEDAKEEGDEKMDEDDAMDTKDEDMVDANEIKEETKSEAIENGELEGEKNNTEVNNSDEVNSAPTSNIPWFSILPRQSCDFAKPIEIDTIDVNGDEKKVGEEDGAGGEGKAELTFEELRAKRHEICPALAKRLEELEAEQYESPKKIHPQYQCGWWRITDAQQLKSILSVLHERGSRERILHKHLTKHFQYACNSCKNTTVDFEITSYDRQLAGKNYGAPVPHTDDDSADDLRDVTSAVATPATTSSQRRRRHTRRRRHPRRTAPSTFGQ